MRRKKILILPKLRDSDGDLTKKWYVEISQRNPSNDEMVRRRFETFNGNNINNFKTKEERYEFADKIIAGLNERLNSGWTIFNDTVDCVFEDQLQYAATARFYRKKVETNNNYSYWVSLFLVEELLKKESSNDTVRTYKSRYRVFGNWLQSQNLSIVDCSAITGEVVVRFFDYLKNDRKLCSHTYGSYRQLLFTLFKFRVPDL